MFIGHGMCACLALAAAGAGQTPASASKANPSVAEAARAAWWARDGLVVASVEDVLTDRAWQTTGGRTRRPTYNERQAYEDERSEAALKQLAAAGVTLVLVPFGGYGPDKLEKEERRIARETIARGHRLGMHAGVWLPVNQIDPEVWKPAEPRGLDWLIRDGQGHSMAALFHGRFFLSGEVGAVRQRTQRMARDAVEAGADAIFLPEWRMAMGQEAAGLDAFRTYLDRAARGDATAARLKGMIGARGAGIDGSAELGEAWRACRVQSLGNWTAVVAEEARRSGREILIGADALSIGSQLAARSGAAVDPATLLAQANALTANMTPTVDERGEIRHQIAECKAVVAAGGCVIPRYLTPISLAQQLAFGGDAAGIAAYFNNGHLTREQAGRRALDPAIVAMVQAYRKHRELYVHMRPVADAALILPRAARLTDAGAALTMQARIAAALVVHRVPFSYVFDDDLHELPRDAVAMVAGVPTLAREQADVLRRHVTDGGALAIAGACEVMERSGGKPSRGLIEYISGAKSTPAPEGQVGRVGAGRVVRISDPGPAAGTRMMTRKRSRYRAPTPPENDAFAAAIHAALGRPVSVEGTLDAGGAVEWTASADGRTHVLHVVNFNRDGPLGKTRMTVRVSDSAAIHAVRRYHIDELHPEDVEFRREAGGISFDVGPVRLYDAYRIE